MTPFYMLVVLTVWAIGRPEEGLQQHQAALEIFERQQELHGTAETLDLMAMGNTLYGDIVNSVRLYERAIAQLRVVGDNKILSSSLTTCGVCNSSAFVETTFSTLQMQDVCIQQLTEALHLAQQGDWLAGQAFAEMDHGFVHMGFGAFGEALMRLHHALHIATEIEHQQWLAGTHCAFTQLYFNLLAPDLAIQHAEKGMRLARHLGARRVTWAWGRLALSVQEPEVALRIAEWLIASAPNATNMSLTQPIPHLLTLKGEALIMLQRFDEASSALHDAKRGAQLKRISAIYSSR